MCDCRLPISDCRLPARVAAPAGLPQPCRARIGNRQWRIENAFTLTELIVAIAIMVVLMAVGTMSYSAMFGGARTDSAINTISAAVGASRAFVGRPKASVLAGYTDDGIALVFTPAGEIRMTENVWYARNGSNQLLETDAPPRNGYADLPDVPYFNIPASAAVVALIRNASGAAGLKLLAPPFAVHFNRNGQIVSAQPSASSWDRVVYYDGDYDGAYETSSGRPGNYDPAAWDPSEDAAYNSDGSLIHWNGDADRMELPFEELETVLAVIVFDRTAFKNANHTLAGSGGSIPTSSGSAGEWILQNGTVLFFNRYTGAVIKEQ